MYRPSRYNAVDPAVQLEIIRQNSFATLVSQNEVGKIIATHIPILLEERGADELYLVGHLAAANPQSQYFLNQAAQEVLVIFQGPHAYISPSLYQSRRNVPTWNYVAAHVYGKLQVIPEAEKHLLLLEKTIQYYEPDYMLQWQELPQEYIEALRQEITAIEIAVSSIEAQTKLSQNKTQEEQKRIAASLLDSHDTQQQLLGKWMEKNLVG